MYFEAMPKMAVTHIQKRAPGPPMLRDRATPTMLPVPTVAPSAVLMAWKEEISPLAPSCRERRPNCRLIALVKSLSWIRPRRTVRKMPVPMRRGSRRKGPQIKLLAVSSASCRVPTALFLIFLYGLALVNLSWGR